jgi:hypothetical protein
MVAPNYAYAKRQKEIAKKQKKLEKQNQKSAKQEDPVRGTSTEPALPEKKDA